MEFEFNFPLIMLKFQKPVEWMYSFGTKHKKAVKRIGNVAVVLGILGMILAMWLMIKGAFTVINGGPSQVGLVIPGVRLPGSQLFIPFWEGIISIFFLAIFHEGMHGIMAAAEGIKSRYTALLLMLVIPAAGVELDEQKLKKKSKMAKLRIFSAGSLGNFILALICLALIFPTGKLISGLIVYDGLLITNSTNPALESGDLLTEINGIDISSFNNLITAFDELVPNSEIIIKVNEEDRVAKLNEEGKLGVYLEQQFHFTNPLGKLLGFIFRVLDICFKINIGVGIINLLPLGILDGGRMMAEISKKWYKLIGIVSGILLIFNILGPIVF